MTGHSSISLRLTLGLAFLACLLGGTLVSGLHIPATAPGNSTGIAVASRSLTPRDFGQAGSKVCLAWGEGNDPSLAKLKTSHVVGLYTWTPQKPSASDSLGFQFWPILWGGDQSRIDAFEATVTAGYGTIVLGFNEPNEAGQSNLDPNTAAALWKQHIEPKRSLGYKTCSPAVSARPNGMDWMKQFLQACSGCTIDYQCLHWYDIGFDKLRTYLTNYHNTFGLPILLTEFFDQNSNGGTQPTSSDVYQFMQQALQYFDATDWILAACPFGFVSGNQGSGSLTSMQNADGSPNALGKLVINGGT